MGLLIQIQTADQLAERDAQAAEAAAAASKPRPIVDELAAWVRLRYHEAEEHKAQTVTPRLLDCERRARLNQYDAETLALLQEQGGSQTYYRLTAQKVIGFLGWLGDVLRSQERPWTLAPTPVPDLPEDVREEIVQRTMAFYAPVIAQGQEWSPEDVQRFAMTMYDQVMGDQQREARKRVSRMEEHVADVLEEGRYWEALDDFLDAFATYPTAFLKGPRLEMQRRVRYEQQDSEDGGTRTVPVFADDPVQVWDTVSPHDIYPDPQARRIQDGYVIERVWYQGEQLEQMAMLPGYDASAIARVIEQGAGMTPGDTYQSERAAHETRDTLGDMRSGTNGEYASVYQALEFWGSVPAQFLARHGVAVEGRRYVDACVVLIGNEVIRAQLNPDPLGTRPYYAASFLPVPGSLWGKGLPEVMADCQDGYNRAMRAADNNLALASGPQVGVDLDVLPPEFDYTQVVPWRVWPLHGKQISTTQLPLTFFQPQMLAGEFLRQAQYHDERADAVTGIPRYATGDPNVRGAAQTASGLQQLLGAAAKGLRRALAEIDRRVLRPSVTAIYRWEMVYGDDEARKGDAQVQARGALYNLVRDQTLERTQAFAAQTANPIDLQILGLPGRAKLLRSIAQQLRIPERDLIPSEEELQARLQAEQQAQAQQQAAAAAQGASAGPVVVTQDRRSGP